MTFPRNIHLDQPAPTLDSPALVQAGVSILHQRKYSIPEASKLSGISESSMRNSVKAGELPVLRVTRAKVLILESDLEHFLETRHGTIRIEKVTRSKLPVLPDYVTKSKYLKRKAA